jgi:uncharacterized glyoxalase superfamily protein PhnB
VRVSGSVLMLADQFPEYGAIRPSAEISSAVAFYLAFDDVDAVWEKAIAAGATEHRPSTGTPFGERYGQIIDPFGYRWGTYATSPGRLARRDGPSRGASVRMMSGRCSEGMSHVGNA